MNIYFISGLGADERIFENLILTGAFTLKYICWIEPLGKESLENYCLRLAKQIDNSEEFILIGLSLGGMVAVEMNKFLSPKKTIIISSVATHLEYSPLLNLLRRSKIQTITPSIFLKTPSPIAQWFFGVETLREKILLRSFMKNVSNSYLKWAVDVVLNWKNQWRPDGLLHVHGGADKIFPFKCTQATIKVEKGGHLMIHDKAAIINPILQYAIENYNSLNPKFF
ncbi:MAG: hypothetical protein NVS1B13_04140 [Flavisolibacter sp.]